MIMSFFLLLHSSGFGHRGQEAPMQMVGGNGQPIDV